jgi:hypothetical protein
MVHPLLYICHPVVHRKLQNVVYMKKNRCSKKKKKKKKKKKGGNIYYRVLSTTTGTRRQVASCACGLDLKVK